MEYKKDVKIIYIVRHVCEIVFLKASVLAGHLGCCHDFQRPDLIGMI